MTKAGSEKDFVVTANYDVVVIGAGSGGVRFARMAAKQGARVAIIEARYYGGTCVNVGCVPKKLYVYAAQFAEAFRDAAGFGWSLPEAPVFDWEKLKRQRAEEITRLNGIYEKLLANHHVDRYWGEGVFKDQHHIQVGAQCIRGDNVVIATGGWPTVPKFSGHEHVLTSNEFFDLPTLPKRCLVLGAGYIGVELAGILAGLGVEVTLAFRGAQILRGFDDEVRDCLAEQLTRQGINLLNGHAPSALTVSADGGYDMTFANGAQMPFDCVLACLGRHPLTTGLNLAAAGVETADNGAIPVSTHFQTNVPHIYALGDVIDRVALTPVALGEGMVLADNLFGAAKAAPRSMDYTWVPTTVFSQPNLATIGLTEAQAVAQGPVAVYTAKFRPMKNTLSGSNQQSFCKLLICDHSQRILGMHILAPDAGEVLQGFAVAIKMGATLADLHRTVGIHPTLAEELVTMREPVRRLSQNAGESL